MKVIHDQRPIVPWWKSSSAIWEVLREELARPGRMKIALKEVFIPETKENIKKIEIYLGDVERLAIGCAKLVKKKKEEKKASA